MLQQLHRDLWVLDRPQRFLGLEIGARMAAIRLPEELSLLLYGS